MKFIIQCEMEDRWVPHFLAMLKRMQYLGNIGSSRKVALYSDGDGDFQPKFKWNIKWNIVFKDEVKPIEDKNGNYLYDAG